MSEHTEERPQGENHVLKALLLALAENRQAATDASKTMSSSIDKLAAAHDTSTREIRDELRALGRLNTAIVVVAMLGLFGLLGIRFNIAKDQISTSPMGQPSPMGGHVPTPSDIELKHEPDEKPPVM